MFRGRGRGITSSRGGPPEGNWRGGRGGGSSTPRRGGRNIHNSDSAAVSDNEGTPIEPAVASDEAEHRGLSGNRYLEMKNGRDAEKERFIAAGLMNDPYKAVSLKDAITMVGTCMDMCPEYERHEREFQNNVDRYEAIDPDAKPRRIDHELAVKAFQRATQGTEPIPSDLRPLPVLKKTLDYLFHTLLVEQGLQPTHAFIWDRTRAIRREFGIQRLEGPEVAEMLERIARYHALCLFRFSHLDEDTFSIKHEREQLDKSLQSLLELYDDGRGKFTFPNEAEFRAFRDARPAFYKAFENIRVSKTPLPIAPADPPEVDIIDGYYQPLHDAGLPPSSLASIPRHASLGAAPGSYASKSRAVQFQAPSFFATPSLHPPSSAVAAAAANGFAAAPAPSSASTFGGSSIFGKGIFGQGQSTAPPLAFGVAPPNSSSSSSIFAGLGAPSLPSTSVFPPLATKPDAPEGTSNTFFRYASAGESAPSSTSSVPSFFSNLGASTSTSSTSGWPGGTSSAWTPNPLAASFAPTNPLFKAPEQTSTSASDEEAVRAKLAAEAAVAAAEAEAAAQARAEEEEQAAVLRAAEEEKLRAQRAAQEAAEADRRRREARELNEKREQSLKEKLRLKAEVERARRTAVEEAEADRRADMELAAVAEMARRQAEEDVRAHVASLEALRLAELPVIAENWCRQRLLRRMWARWTQRAVDRAILLEQQENLSRRRDAFNSSVRNLVAGGSQSPASQNSRVRPRHTPISDEQRAKSLEQESARHAKLWAVGSFTNTLRQLIGNVPLWEVWLSPSSADGASSAWLKAKFGVANERSKFHKIPIYDDISKEYFSSASSPGLLVFEESGDASSDCRRLEQLVKQFPRRSHYAPSLLLIRFSGQESTVTDALKSAIQALGKSGALHDARVLVLSATNDMDKQFANAVSSLNLDVTGTLVQRITLDTFVNTYMSSWEIPLNTWISLCTDAAGFNWQLYGAVLAAMLGLLNDLSHAIAAAVNRSQVPFILPPFEWQDVMDGSAAFDFAHQYLSSSTLAGFPDAHVLHGQLLEAAGTGSDFPVYAFPERIGQLVANLWRSNSKVARHVYLPRDTTEESLTEDFRKLIQSQLHPLNGLIRFMAPSPPLSPSTSSSIVASTSKKRNAEDMRWDEDVDFITNGDSPGKRRKGVNGNGYDNADGDPRSPPSPALSTISLMSTSSVGGSKRGSRLRALMDKMRSTLKGESMEF